MKNLFTLALVINHSRYLDKDVQQVQTCHDILIHISVLDWNFWKFAKSVNQPPTFMIILSCNTIYHQ